MSARSSILCVLAALLLCASTCAQAAYIGVTVRPDGPATPNGYDGCEQQCTNNWTIDTYNLGWGQLCPWGPSTYEGDQLYGSPARPFPGGTGAFYATCDMFKGTWSGSPYPSNVWLGTDTWNGESLAGKTLGSITEMNYWAFVSEIPQRWAGGVPSEVQWWNKNNWWGYPQQPICLELTAESPDGTDRRQFWCRPDGYNYTGDDGHRTKGLWYQWNCLGGVGKWYIPRSADVTADPDAEEFGAGLWTALMSNSLAVQFPTDPAGDTPSRIALFSEWKLVAPNTAEWPTGWKSGGWKSSDSPPGEPNANGTGKPLNFHVGARTKSPGPMYLQGDSTAWANESYGYRGQVDGFALGFDGTSVLFDFEPETTNTTRRTVASSIRGLAEQTSITEGRIVKLAPIMRTSNSEQPLVNPLVDTNYTQKKNHIRIVGKVSDTHQGAWDNSTRQYTNSYFRVEDGSALVYTDWGPTTLAAPVLVFVAPRADGLDIWNNDYVSVIGFVEPLRWKYGKGWLCRDRFPLIMWSTPRQIVNFSE